MYNDRPNKSRLQSPPVSIYMLGSDDVELVQLSCMFCKRTILDVKGVVADVIVGPMPVTDFDIAINARCKLCGQNYRILINPKPLPELLLG